MNRALVREVLSMRAVRESHPEVYDSAADRRIENPQIHELAFRAIVAAQVLAAAGLATGTLLLALAALGSADTSLARAVAMAAVVAFTAIWGAFLIGGEWVHYWAGAGGAQSTHQMMAIWGAATFAALA